VGWFFGLSTVFNNKKFKKISQKKISGIEIDEEHKFQV
jgi:hypothetical protein